ncbi:MAG TPA: hypothetical protein VLS85_00935 [Hanamia sp.]|nr:hypothetical protein [Hanamia sp.]
MKKSILFLIVFHFSIFAAKAQNDFRNNNQDKPNTKNSGIVISLGAAANYYYGPGDRNFDKYENDRLNWQINGMLGLTIARSESGHRTMLAGFGSFGMNNAKTVSHIFDDQGYVTTATDQNSNNNVYQLEGGLLIGEVFRISTGVGQQIFNKQTITSSDGLITQATSLKYNSTTVGFNFNVSAVAIIINCNFEYGQDYTKTVIIPSAGLMLRF